MVVGDDQPDRRGYFLFAPRSPAEIASHDCCTNPLTLSSVVVLFFVSRLAAHFAVFYDKTQPAPSPHLARLLQQEKDARARVSTERNRAATSAAAAAAAANCEQLPYTGQDLFLWLTIP